MSIDRTNAYAEALLTVAAAEGDADTVKSQLTDIARAVDSNDELRSALTNKTLPVAVRSQILDDVLANRASDTTKALVGMIVATGRGGDLAAIASAVNNRSAAGVGRQVATVRAAVDLTADQRARLSAALAKSVGSEVDLDVIVDPSVVGGAVTTIGDTVIDGSLRTRLSSMREAL